MVVTLAVFHDAMSPLNETALANMYVMVVTLAVFHDAMLPLNVVCPLKRDPMLVTVEVSQTEISPYVAVAVVGLLIHAATAV